MNDGGTPVRSDTSVLTITIRRNLNSPFFNPTSYPLEINEDQQLGVSIGQVFATDADAPKVCNFLMLLNILGWGGGGGGGGGGGWRWIN